MTESKNSKLFLPHKVHKLHEFDIRRLFQILENDPAVVKRPMARHHTGTHVTFKSGFTRLDGLGFIRTIYSEIDIEKRTAYITMTGQLEPCLHKSNRDDPVYAFILFNDMTPNEEGQIYLKFFFPGLAISYFLVYTIDLQNKHWTAEANMLPWRESKYIEFP